MTAGCTPAQDAQEKLEFLADPRHHADGSRRVDVVETHFAWVFLTKRHAYKLKKPIRQASMDYRTLADRERGCREEVRLNRRLAPQIYLGVVPLSRRRDGRLTLGRASTVVDWLVRMRRLPAERALDRAIAAGTVTAEKLDAIVRLLAAFFSRAVRRPLTAQEYLERLRTRTRRNARDLSAPDLRLSRARVTAVLRAQLEFLSAAAGSLGPRGARLVDGHGDLRPEHVYLGPQPCVIDCLEFDPDLRRLDPAEEMAFLALECTRLGGDGPRVGAELLRRYRAAMQDPLPDALVQFYMSQRAVTRAKIAAWHVRDPQFPRHRPWIARANSYLVDALRCAREALAALPEGRRSVVRGDGPLAQQRRERPAVDDASHRLPEQWRDPKDREPLRRRR